MEQKHHHYLQIFLFLVLVGNIGFFWISQIYQQRQVSFLSQEIIRLEKGIKTLTSVPIGNSVKTEESSISSSSSTVVTNPGNSSLEKRVATLEQDIKKISTPQPTSSTVASESNDSTVKEYFIYLGSGSASSTEWTNIPGAVVTIDAGQYKNIKDVRFEAGLSIVSGNAYARLINQDSSSAIFGTEVLHNTSTPTWKTSSSINLQSGNSTYMVQLRSSNGERVDLSGARIKIILN